MFAPAVWDDEASEVEGIKSSWSTQRKAVNLVDESVGCSLPRIGDRDAASQTLWGDSSPSDEAQTEPFALPGVGDGITEEEILAQAKTRALSDPALPEFLRKIIDPLCSQLDANLLSHAFDDYRVLWEDTVDSIQQTTKLTFSAPNEPDKGKEYSCTGLAWNSTGSILAAGYGALAHSGWCSHRGFVHLWAVFKKNLRTQRKPQLAVELGSCAMCIAFHPVLPTVAAVGTFNGQVVIIDSDSIEDPTLVITDLNDDNGHREPVRISAYLSINSKVAAICWLDEGKSKISTEIASCSGDGKVIVWSWGGPPAPSKISLTRSLSLRGKGKESAVVSGASAMAFFSGERAQLVVGTEGGKLYKCTLEPTPSNSPTSGLNSGTVQFPYEEQKAPILHLEASPFHRNLFISAGADSTIRLYNTMIAKSALTVIPSTEGSLFCVSWSPSRPSVFATGSADGCLYIFDIADPVGRIKPTATLRVTKKSSVQTVCFNKKVSGCVATGLSSGTIKVWQLSHPLTAPKSTDLAVLASFGELKAK